MKQNSLYLRCTCSSEVLAIDHDDTEYYLALFKTQYGWDYRWRDRIRHIWQIITKGHPFTDSIVLTKEHMLTLKNWIEQQENFD